MQPYEFSFFDDAQARAEPTARQILSGPFGNSSIERVDTKNTWRQERLDLFIEDNKRRTPCSICQTLVLPHLHQAHRDMLHPN